MPLSSVFKRQWGQSEPLHTVFAIVDICKDFLSLLFVSFFRALYSSLPLFSVPVQAEITTEVITYPVGDDITLNCQVKSYMPSTIAWYNGEEPIVESEKFKVVGQFIITFSGLYT